MSLVNQAFLNGQGHGPVGWFGACGRIGEIRGCLCLTRFIDKGRSTLALVAAAVIGASFFTANPAEARNGWVYVGTDVDGDAHYAKVDSYAGKYVNLQVAVQPRMNPYPMTIDCKKWSKTFQSNGGGWSPIYPGTMAATNARTFCR